MNRDLYPHQSRAVLHMLQAYSTGLRTFRMNMITGSGKTVSAIHAVERLLAEHPELQALPVVVVCHTNGLKAQFKRNIEDEDALIGLKGKWSVYTYHTLRTKKMQAGVLIVDEAHQGGLEKKEEKVGSYAKIVKELKPAFLLSLTATDSGLDEAIFGAKTSENTFTYTYREALEDGIINECEIRTIHTALEQTLDDGSTIVGEDVLEVGRLDAAAGVNLNEDENSEVIQKTRISAAIETYHRNEAGKQAVFFVPTIALVNWAVAEFRRVVGHKTRVVGSHSGEGGDDENIGRFRRGEVDVLFNCRKVQEGFDYPALAVAFDCCPSVSNEGRMLIQRLGRVVRKTEEKGLSRYYVLLKPAVKGNRFDITKATGSKASEAVDAHVELMAEVQTHVEQDGLDKTVGEEGVAVEVPQEVGSFSISPVVSHVKGQMPTSVRVTEVTSRIITKASGSKEASCVLLSEMLREGAKKPDGYWDVYENVLEAARGCSNPTDLSKKFSGAAASARKNGWISLLFPEHLPNARMKEDLWKESVLAFCVNYRRPPHGRSEDRHERSLAAKMRKLIIADSGFADQIKPFRDARRDERKVTSVAAMNRATAKHIICVESGETYSSVAQAVRSTGITSIGVHLAGRTKSAGGFTWRYATEEEIATLAEGVE